MLLNHNHNLRTLHVVMLCFVSLAGNVIPAPAGFVAAEQAEDQRATSHRQSLIGGNSPVEASIQGRFVDCFRNGLLSVLRSKNYSLSAKRLIEQ